MYAHALHGIMYIFLTVYRSTIAFIEKCCTALIEK